MLIKLTKKAQWASEVRRSGTVHDVDDRVAQKLIERGLATVKTKEDKPEAEDAATDSE